MDSGSEAGMTIFINTSYRHSCESRNLVHPSRFRLLDSCLRRNDGLNFRFLYRIEPGMTRRNDGVPLIQVVK